MAERVVLSIDLGTSGMKSALITTHGKVLGWEFEPIPLNLTPDGGAEQSPLDWWQAFMLTSKRLIQRGLVPPQSIQAVCCSTQGEGTVPVDREGNPLMNCILWMDMRGAAALSRQSRGWVNVAGVRLDKVVNWIRLTGGMPSATGKDPAGHMLFIRDVFPDVYEKTYKFLNVLDYINLRLTGRYCATFDSILTSWVTDNRDPDRIQYHESLIRQSGIDRGKLPDIVRCSEVIGNLKPEIRDALGLTGEIQVVAGAIDNTAAAIGSGAVEDYAVHLYLGTSSWLAAHVPFKKTDIQRSMASVPCAIPHRYLLTALQATAGGNLTFLKNNVLYHKDELLREADVPDVYKIMDRIAETVPAGSNGVIYTPWIWGERSPVEDRTLRAGLYNLSLHNTRADIIRAFLEGIALNTRWMIDPVEHFLGRKVDRIRLVGGGGNSNIWCQIFADVMNIEIAQMQDPIQANARGAALIAAVGLGDIGIYDIPALIPVLRYYSPAPENRSLYDERFSVFTEIYRQMHSIYRKLNIKLQH